MHGYIMGLGDTGTGHACRVIPCFSEVPLPAGARYVGIRFFPSALSGLFQLNAAEFVNTYEPLGTVHPKFAQQLVSASPPGYSLDRLGNAWDELLYGFLAKRFPAVNDSRFSEALSEILRCKGTLSIERDLDTGLSPRQLRRVFKQHVGCTPKTFAQIIRFQYILSRKPTREDLRKEKWYFDLGYYDQAHFVKEFKRFYGLSPTQAFS